MKTKPRTYGVILQNVIRDTDISLQPLYDALGRCGERIDRDHVFRLSSNDNAGLDRPEAAQQAILKLKTDGITTVFNLGMNFVEQYIPTAADNQSYYPEWIFSTYSGNVVEYWWSDSAKSPTGVLSDGSLGAVCYVNRARRVRIGAIPTGSDPFFQQPCYPGPS